MRNFFRKRRTPSYGDEDMRPEDFDPVLDTGAGPRLVPPLGRGPALSAEAEEEDGGDGRGMHSFQRSALGIVGERASERADERGSAEAAGRAAPQRPLSAEEDDPDLELPQFRMPVTAGLQDGFRGRLRDPAALPGMTPELNRALRE